MNGDALRIIIETPAITFLIVCIGIFFILVGVGKFYKVRNYKRKTTRARKRDRVS